MKVNKSKARTPDEEYAFIWEQINTLGDYFPWDVHPNVLRATALQRKRLYKKLKNLVDSAEFQEYNPWYK